MLRFHTWARWSGTLLLVAVVALGGTGCTKQMRVKRYLTRANNDFQAGQFDRAEVEYLNVLRLAPRTPIAVSHLALIYYEQGRLQAAFIALQQAAQLEPDNAEVRLKLCRTRFLLGRVKEAREDALKVLAKQPGEEEALTTLAETAVTPKELEDTRQQLEHLRQGDKDRAGYNVALATVMFKQGQATNALGELQKARALDPKSLATLVALGNFYWRVGDLQQAEPALKAAAELAPLRSRPKLRYAQFKQSQGDSAGARQLLQDLTKQAPDYLPAWLALAELSLDEGKLDECDTVLQRILNRAPEDFEGLLVKGQLKLAQGDVTQAVTEFTRMSEAFPNSPQVQYELARAYLAQGDEPKAVSRLERALTLNPFYADATVALASVRLQAGDTGAAISSLNTLLKQQPEVINARFLLASAYLKQQNASEGIAEYRRMLQRFPKDPRVPVALAGALIAQGQRSEARQLCAQAMQLSPGYLPALQTLGDLDVVEHQPQAALARINEQIAKQPASAELQLLLARIYLEQKDPAGAEAPLLKAIALAPKLRTPYQFLAQVYVDTHRPQQALDKLAGFVAKTNDVPTLMQIGLIQETLTNYSAARDAYEKILSVDPRYSPALNNLACLYVEHLNEPDKALEAAASARQLSPNSFTTADTLGWVWFRKGEYVKALPLLEDAASRAPMDTDIQFHLGMTRYALGQEGPARSALQTAVGAGQDFRGKAEAQARLAILAIDPKTASSDARTLLEKRVDAAPDDTLALGRLAAVYDRDGAVDKAAKSYEQLLKLAPKNGPALARLSLLYAGPLKDPQKALDLAKDAHAAAPGDASISQALGHLVLQTGDYKWAAGLLQEASSATPNQPDLCFDLAQARYGLGQYQDASASLQTALAAGAGFARSEEAKRFAALLNAYRDPAQRPAAGPQVEAALKADPNNLPALLVQAMQQKDKGDDADAKKTLEQVLGVNARFAPALREYAVLCAARFPDEPKAYDLAMKARDTFPDDAALTGALGILAYNKANYTAAVQYLKQSLQAHPGDGPALYYLGMAQYQVKAKAESKATLQQALALNLEPKLADQAKRVLTELK